MLNLNFGQSINKYCKFLCYFFFRTELLLLFFFKFHKIESYVIDFRLFFSNVSIYWDIFHSTLILLHFIHFDKLYFISFYLKHFYFSWILYFSRNVLFISILFNFQIFGGYCRCIYVISSLIILWYEKELYDLYYFGFLTSIL